MIRLIASDIDGTLLQNGATEIPEEIFQEIHRLAERGILFCPASGRQYSSLRRLFAPAADRLPFLCENGAVVFGPGSPGPVLAKTVMDRPQAEALCRDIMALPGAEVLVSGADTAYICPKRPELLEIIRDFLGNRTVTLASPDQVPEDIVKVSAWCPGCLEETWQALSPRWGGVFRAAIAGEAWVDFTLADKGTGLTRLCAALGIGLEEVMAFGDNYNDLPMLERVGRPYIMETAAPELREKIPNRCRTVAETLRAAFPPGKARRGAFGHRPKCC